MSQDPDFTDAVHEAAHVIVVRALGYSVEFVSLAPEIANASGVTSSTLRLPERLGRMLSWAHLTNDHDRIEHEIINSMAGFAAEAILRGDRSYQPPTTLEQVRSSDDKQVVNCMMRRYDRDSRPEHYRRIYYETRRLLTANWADVLTVARVLEAQISLTGEQVDDLLTARRFEEHP